MKQCKSCWEYVDSLLNRKAYFLCDECYDRLEKITPKSEEGKTIISKNGVSKSE
jgi:uncharacterized protein YlaI